MRGKREAKRNGVRRWQAAVLVCLAVTLLLGGGLDREQEALADDLVRLHVLANSDSPEDQAMKLRVRDAVLQKAGELVGPGDSREQAEAKLKAALPALAAAGAQVVGQGGQTCPVTASWEEQVWFPTRTYGDLSLPAGQYTALRVVIGEGKGQNWWCVVFPPICLGSVTARTPAAGLEAEEAALVTGESEGYVVKFRLMELVEGAKRRLNRGNP